MKTEIIDRRTARSLPVRFALVAAIGSIALLLSPLQSPRAYGQPPTFTTLAAFNGTNGTDQSWSNLTLIGSTLYGTANGGGANNTGCVFSIATNGAGGINDLYDFTASGAADGNGPNASLTQVGGSLYGTCGGGGPNGSSGTIFSINANATSQANANFQTVGYFPNGASNADGYPAGGVTNVNGTLFGVNGGGNNTGCFTAFPRPAAAP